MKHLYDFNEDFEGEITINNKAVHLMVTAKDILSIVQKGVEEARKTWLVDVLTFDTQSLQGKSLTLAMLDKGIWIRAERFMLLESTYDFAYYSFKKICDHPRLWMAADEEHLPDDLISGVIYAMADVSQLTPKECNAILLLTFMDIHSRPADAISDELCENDGEDF